MFASLEEKFLASCQNSRGTSQFKRTNGETKKKHHARLPAQVPASSVSKSPGGNKGQERKDAVPGQDNREGNRGHKGKKKRKTVQSSITCRSKRQWRLGSFEHVVPSHAWQNDVKASVNNAWQISPFCHMLLVGAFVLDGTSGKTEKFCRASSDKHNEVLLQQIPQTQ